MVAIAPFRALRFDPAQVDLDAVTSPPHDVITEDEQAAFRAQDAHSIVHIIQPAAADGDAEYPGSPNKYERARDLIAAWQNDGALVRDDAAAFYRYEIQHGDGVMSGFFARLKLDPTYTEIQRHEKTLGKKKRDRLNLQETTLCNTESIWMLYRDERGWVDEILSSNSYDEIIKTTDPDGMTHRVWRVDRAEAVGEIVAQFEDRHVVIADGHHRYQTALDHYAATGADTDDSILVCMVRDTDPGLRIDPTHRLVNGTGLSVEDALAAADKNWHVEPASFPDAGAVRAWVDADPTRCVIVAGTRFWQLSLRPEAAVDEGRGRLDSLVVTRVHDRLLAEWGIGADDVEDHLTFSRSAQEALDAAASGACEFAVLLTGEEVSAVLDVASEGHVMPQKATYFVPKLRSGLVLGPLDEPSPRPWQEIGGDGGKPDARIPSLD